MRDEENPRVLTWAPYVAIFALVLAVIIYALWFGTPLSGDQAVWGQFGDYLAGVLNPLFALFAFLILIESVRLQKKEMALARQEMHRTAKAAEDQFRLAQETQTRNELLALIRVASDDLSELLSRVINVNPRTSLKQLLKESYRSETVTDIASSQYNNWYLGRVKMQDAHISQHAESVQAASNALARFVTNFEKSFGAQLGLKQFYSEKHRHLRMLFRDLQWDESTIEGIFEWTA